MQTLAEFRDELSTKSDFQSRDWAKNITSILNQHKGDELPALEHILGYISFLDDGEDQEDCWLRAEEGNKVDSIFQRSREVSPSRAFREKIADYAWARMQELKGEA